MTLTYVQTASFFALGLLIFIAHAGSEPITGRRCPYHPQIVFLQDMSSSGDLSQTWREQLSDLLLRFLKEEFDNQLYFGIASFVDKVITTEAAPQGITGLSGDYCARVNMPLYNMKDPDGEPQVYTAVSLLAKGNGGDWLDGLDEALFRVASSEALNWRNETYDPVTKLPYLRIIVGTTDASVHRGAWLRRHWDWYRLLYEEKSSQTLLRPASPPPLHTLRLNPEVLYYSANMKCRDMDYVDVADVGAALRKRNALPVVLSIPPRVRDPFTGDFEMTSLYHRWLYDEHLNGTKYDDKDDGLRKYYEDYLEDAEVQGISASIDDYSTSMVDVLRTVMRQVDELACDFLPTTTTTTTPDTEDAMKHADTTGDQRDDDDDVDLTPEDGVSKAATDKDQEADTKDTAADPGTTTTHEEVPPEEPKGRNTAAITGGAVAGATAGVAGVAAAAAKVLGVGPFNTGAAPTNNIILEDIDQAEVRDNREQFEIVSGDLFT